MLLIGPVVVFVSMVTRVGAARREQRFAAIRLAGATRWQTAVLAATETAVAAVAGTLLGCWGSSWPGRSWPATSRWGMACRSSSRTSRRRRQVLLVLVAVPLIAVATTLVALHRVQITPLGARRRARRRRPRLAALPLAAGIVGVWYSAKLQSGPANDETTLLRWVAPSPRCPYWSAGAGRAVVCMWISRGLARLAGARPR